MNVSLISLIVISTATCLATLLPAQQQSDYRMVGAALTGASEVQSGRGSESRLVLESSEARLVEAFQWAKRQAMAYVFEGDPVGPWYEAAEPGREAFCMRDVAHQAMGGHALGLARHNLNMLRRFAENISDSRDWCSYWEIDRYNRPAPVDYKSDAEFWYNLPANFDILDCCLRMYLWTGDRTYTSDPVFLNYYDRTVSEYVARWGLGLDQVMKRPRLLNVRGIFDPGKKFQPARGIPGYDEGDREYTLGVDVLATQYAGYRSYARIQEIRGNEELARTYFRRAAEVRALINSAWWNDKEQYFYLRLDKDHKLEGRAGASLLYWDAVDGAAKTRSALASGRAGAEVLYRYGDPDEAYGRMLEVALGPRSRREYPEVPYSWLGALVNGTMGITLEAESPLESARSGFWVETIVKTLPGLGTKIGWAELRNLPIRSNEVTVRHEGVGKTVLTNQRGPAMVWQAAFRGSYPTLLVNGQPINARAEKSSTGRDTSWVRVTVGGGGTVRVQIPD